MRVARADESKEIQITEFPYKGVPLPVRDVTVRWLSQAGPADSPEYGLRLFRIGPSGEIPIHKHFYYQTMYVLSGAMVVAVHDPETDAKTDERRAGPAEVVFIPTMEPHSIVNASAEEECVFLCAIANVYDN